MTYGDALPADVRRENAVPVMSSGGVTGWHDTPNTLGPCIVVGRKGSHGSVWWSDSPAFVIDTAYSIDHSNSQCNLRWLYYVLVSARLGEVSADVGVPGLSRESAYEALIPAPPEIEEQRRIADFLDDQVTRIDAVIDARAKQIALLNEWWSAYVADRLSLSGAPLVKLGRVLLRPPDYGANAPAEFEETTWPRYIRTTDIDSEGGLRSDTFRSLPPQVAAEYLLHDGDVLFTRSGATVGKSFIYREAWGPAAFAGYLIRLRPDRSRLLPEWLRFFAETPEYWQQIAESSIQATIPNVNAEKYAGLRLPVADVSVQVAVAADLEHDLSRLRAQQSAIRRSVELLEELRRSLITATVTGKLDVSSADGSRVSV